MERWYKGDAHLGHLLQLFIQVLTLVTLLQLMKEVSQGGYAQFFTER